MRRGERAAVIIGSSKIETLIAKEGLNDTFVVTAKADKPYSGFSESRFFDENEVTSLIEESISEISEKIKGQITTVYVGIPNAFIKTECKRLKIKLDKKRKIKQKDVDLLLDAGKGKVYSESREVIHALPINFSLNEKMTLSPIGLVADEIGAYVSYLLCDVYFTSLIRKTLQNSGIHKVKFVSESFAEGLVVLGETPKDLPSIIIDVGYITTSVTLFYGNGIVSSEAYDLGGGYLSATLFGNFDLELDEAEDLKRKINLGFTNSTAFYRLESKGKVRKFSADKVNELAIEVLDGIAEVSDDFLERSLSKFESTISVYLTGGGISFIRGAREHLSSRLGVEIETVSPKIPEKNKPTDTALVGVVKYMLNFNEKGEK